MKADQVLSDDLVSRLEGKIPAMAEGAINTAYINALAAGRSVMGGASNRVHIVTKDGVEDLPEMPKDEVAQTLVERIADALNA